MVSLTTPQSPGLKTLKTCYPACLPDPKHPVRSTQVAPAGVLHFSAEQGTIVGTGGPSGMLFLARDAGVGVSVFVEITGGPRKIGAVVPVSRMVCRGSWMHGYR